MGIDKASNDLNSQNQMELLNSVTTLLLQGNKIKYKGMKALAKSPHLENLQHLDLWGNYIGDLGLKALAESPYLKYLESLKIWTVVVLIFVLSVILPSAILGLLVRNYKNEKSGNG